MHDKSDGMYVLRSAELTGTVRPCTGAEQEAGVPLYVGDVIDEVGPDHARRCYWDYGPWAVLWRSWRQPEDEPVTFEVSRRCWDYIQSSCSRGSLL